MLPIAAPVTAPAVCFGIGGTWISSDDCRPFFFSGSGWSGINDGLLDVSICYQDVSQDKLDIAVTKLRRSVTTIATGTDFEFEKCCQFFVGIDNETPSVAMPVRNGDSVARGNCPGKPKSRTSRAI
jgi:hypothetical protein